MKKISVIGAGLAGSECALQLASLGYQVDLYEMRPHLMTPAHKSGNFAELVCSNSFGSEGEASAPGLLKHEAEKMGSFVLRAAKLAQVPAGQALGVDRDLFSQTLTRWIRNHSLINVIEKPITNLNEVTRPCVVATGPLTDERLIRSMQEHFEEKDFLYFFDAIAPIIDTDSIDMSIAWKADRYGKGTDDYINCPLTKEQYFQFINEVKASKKIEPKHFETTNFFEGCMPIEVMVDRGPQTLRFGPMKPVGLPDPKTQRDPYAVVQLRQDNKEGTAYNMVGFQTRMSYGEQARIFRMIPGLAQAEFLKLGSIHRNLYINSPMLLNRDLSSRRDPWLFFAGQITGVEGYFESTCIGLLVAHFIDQKMMHYKAGDTATTAFTEKGTVLLPPRATAMGSILEAITDLSRGKHFQPTNINFALLPPLSENDLLQHPHLQRDKGLRKSYQIAAAQKAHARYLEHIGFAVDFTNLNEKSHRELQNSAPSAFGALPSV